MLLILFIITILEFTLCQLNYDFYPSFRSGLINSITITSKNNDY